MSLENINRSKIIVLIIVIIILLSTVVSGYFLWFENKDTTTDLNQKVDINELENKFNLDFFNKQIFQDLKDIPQLSTSTNENLGKENPFLKF